MYRSYHEEESNQNRIGGVACVLDIIDVKKQDNPLDQSTSLDGAISSLIVMDKILRILDRSKMKVVAYVGNFVISVSEMFPLIMSKIIEDARGKVCIWAAGCVLSINPTETS